MGTGPSFGVVKCFETRQSQCLHNTVKVLNDSELLTLKWFHLSCQFRLC